MGSRAEYHLFNIQILGSDEMQSASYIQNYGLKNMIQHCLNMHLSQGCCCLGSVGFPLPLGHLGMATAPWVQECEEALSSETQSWGLCACPDFGFWSSVDQPCWLFPWPGRAAVC